MMGKSMDILVFNFAEFAHIEQFIRGRCRDAKFRRLKVGSAGQRWPGGPCHGHQLVPRISYEID